MSRIEGLWASSGSNFCSITRPVAEVCTFLLSIQPTVFVDNMIVYMLVSSCVSLPKAKHKICFQRQREAVRRDVWIKDAGGLSNNIFTVIMVLLNGNWYKAGIEHCEVVRLFYLINSPKALVDVTGSTAICFVIAKQCLLLQFSRSEVQLNLNLDIA